MIKRNKTITMLATIALTTGIFIAFPQGVIASEYSNNTEEYLYGEHQTYQKR